MLDLVIKDGTVVTSTEILKADVGIKNGKIAEITPGLKGGHQIYASEMLILPGGVDPHVHLEMPTSQTVTSDTWTTGSRAAAFGGTTTVIDFVEPAFPDQALLEAFEERLNQAQGKSAIDFSFHMTLCSAEEETLQQVQGVLQAGMTSFKLYTTYPGFHLGDQDLLSALSAIRKAGGLALVHAESDAIVQASTHHLEKAGRLEVKYFPASRPAIAEKEAIERVLSLASFANIPVYIVHISTRAGVEAIRRARGEGRPVWGETCPQYLLLDDSQLITEDFSGAKFVCCPPLRSQEDNQALWAALRDGSLQTVGTDHCAFNFQGQKDLGKDSFLNIPGGLPGIELRLCLLYTYGVKAGRITMPQLVDICCTSPARIFGLSPQKGDLLPGADADLILLDPNSNTKATHASLHEQVDYTPYEGMELKGKVQTTILRGKVLVENGKWVGEEPTGNFLRCSSFPPG
jgi:dihydropyrimidinase